MGGEGVAAIAKSFYPQPDATYFGSYQNSLISSIETMTLIPPLISC